MPNGDGCEYGKLLEGRVKRMEKDIAEVVDNLQSRPSWPTTIYITVLTSLVTGLTVALLS